MKFSELEIGQRFAFYLTKKGIKAYSKTRQLEKKTAIKIGPDSFKYEGDNKELIGSANVMVEKKITKASLKEAKLGDTVELYKTDSYWISNYAYPTGDDVDKIKKFTGKIVDTRTSEYLVALDDESAKSLGLKQLWFSNFIECSIVENPKNPIKALVYNKLENIKPGTKVKLYLDIFGYIANMQTDKVIYAEVGSTSGNIGTLKFTKNSIMPNNAVFDSKCNAYTINVSKGFKCEVVEENVLNELQPEPVVTINNLNRLDATPVIINNYKYYIPQKCPDCGVNFGSVNSGTLSRKCSHTFTNEQVINLSKKYNLAPKIKKDIKDLQPIIIPKQYIKAINADDIKPKNGIVYIPKECPCCSTKITVNPFLNSMTNICRHFNYWDDIYHIANSIEVIGEPEMKKLEIGDTFYAAHSDVGTSRYVYLGKDSNGKEIAASLDYCTFKQNTEMLQLVENNFPLLKHFIHDNGFVSLENITYIKDCDFNKNILKLKVGSKITDNYGNKGVILEGKFGSGYALAAFKKKDIKEKNHNLFEGDRSSSITDYLLYNKPKSESHININDYLFLWINHNDNCFNIVEEQNKSTSFKQELINAGYRVASNQISKGIKTTIVAMLKDKGMEETKLGMAAELINSEIGEALIHLAMGYGLNYLPKYGDDPRVAKLSKEFRAEGLAKAGNEIINTAMEYIVPAIKETVNNLPTLQEKAEDKEEEKELVILTQEQLA